MTDEPVKRPRQFIIRVEEQYCVPSQWNVLRILGTEEKMFVPNENPRVYICLAEEVES